MASSLALPPLVELVRDNGFIDDAQAEELVRAHLQDGKPYKELILALDVLSEEDLLSLMAGSQGTDVIDLSTVAFDDTLKNLIPVASIRLHTIVPVEVERDHATFATADLIEADVIDELTFLLSREIRFVFAPEEAIKKATRLSRTSRTSMASMAPPTRRASRALPPPPRSSASSTSSSTRPLPTAPPIFISSPSRRTLRFATASTARSTK